MVERWFEAGARTVPKERQASQKGLWQPETGPTRRDNAFDNGSKKPVVDSDMKGLNQKGRDELVDFLLRKLQNFRGGSRSPLDQHRIKQTV